LVTYPITWLFGRRTNTVVGDDQPDMCIGGDRAGSLFGWFYPVYRASRGTYRIRARFDPSTHPSVQPITASGTEFVNLQQTAASSTSIPLAIGFTTRAIDSVGDGMNTVPALQGLANVWSNVLDFADTLTSRVYPLGVDAGNVTILNTGPARFLQTGMPLTVADEHANYVDIEVPFISQYKYVMNTLSPANEHFGSEAYNSGSIGVRRPGLQNMMTSSGSLGGGQLSWYQQGRVEIWGAIGDEFRFGIVVGVPPVTWFSTNQGYDIWNFS